MILPVLRWGKRITLWDAPNPWLDAWLSRQADSNFVPIISPYGEAEDLVLISASEVILKNRERLKLISKKYDTEDVLILLATVNNIEGVLSAKIEAFKGFDFEKLEIPLMVANNEDIYALFERSAEEVGKIYDNLWVSNNLEKILKEEIIEVKANFNDHKEWIEIKNLLNQLLQIKDTIILAISVESAELLIRVSDKTNIHELLLNKGIKLDKTLDLWSISLLEEETLLLDERLNEKQVINKNESFSVQEDLEKELEEIIILE